MMELLSCMSWLDFAGGLFAGMTLGILVLSLFVAADRADRARIHWTQDDG